MLGREGLAGIGEFHVGVLGILAPLGIGVQVVDQADGVSAQVGFVHQGALNHVAGAEELDERLSFKDAAGVESAHVEAKLGQEVLPARALAFFDRNHHGRLELGGLYHQAHEADARAEQGKKRDALPVERHPAQQPLGEFAQVVDGDSALQKFVEAAHG